MPRRSIRPAASEHKSLFANAVVEDLDILGDFPLGLLSRSKAAVMRPLIFQGASETLHRRIVPAVALAAHRSQHTKLLQLLPIRMRAVLAGAIRMVD